MSEDEARAWLAAAFDVPRETWRRLERFIALLTAEAARQNLVAASTLPTIWSRHIVDSAQLLTLAARPCFAGVGGRGPVPRSELDPGLRRGTPPMPRTWLDLGSGAGFPGLIVAALSDAHVTLVDSRRKRVAFLAEAAEALGVASRIVVCCSRVETMPEGRFDAISARAFAPLDRLLPIAARFARPDTIWLLPKGKTAVSELEAVRGSWQGMFHVEPSVTDPDAAIIVATQVKPRGNR